MTTRKGSKYHGNKYEEESHPAHSACAVICAESLPCEVCLFALGGGRVGNRNFTMEAVGERRAGDSRAGGIDGLGGGGGGEGAGGGGGNIAGGGSAWWRGLGSPRLVLAPMIDQSELPFRVLCRAHGCELAVSPMFHARHFAAEPKYRLANWSELDGAADDRPLLVQFAANDARALLAAAKLVQSQCDGVDINLGCPQRVARRGHFGAFLLSEHELLRELVCTLRCHLDVPVTCKIRKLPCEGQTADVARLLQAGARSRDALRR